MNRIILIGNGFDLANYLPTSYNDFINKYWEKIFKELSLLKSGDSFENDDFSISKIPPNWYSGNNLEALELALEMNDSELTFKNKFIHAIAKKHQIQNWVDIENEYYDLLKKAFRKNGSTYKVKQLNQDFEIVKNYLSIYLDEIKDTIPENINTIRIQNYIKAKIFSSFRLRDFSEEAINDRAEIEFQKVQKNIEALNDNMISLDDLNEDSKKLITRLGQDNIQKKIRKLLLSDEAINYFDLVPKQILFLNFNYTHTEELFRYNFENEQFWIKHKPEISSIHIHGSLIDKRNPIIFGFGDEIDEDYKVLENLNENEYLENIKSIKYLETDNYKNLLEFVNQGSYQIFIFGHSCGISDRTLLNTLFENKNCASIKPFYHRVSSDQDNYSEIIRNISRNFNSKSLMRDKVVNKNYCDALT